MRVLHVSEVTTGGVAAMLSSVVPAQLRAGHELTVCMPDRLDAVPPELFVPWEVTRSREGLLPSITRLRRVVETVRPDVVHLHSFVAGVLGRLGLRRSTYDAALVYQPHSWNYGAARNPVSLSGLVAVEAALGPRTDALVVNCRAEAAEGRRHGVRAPAVVTGLPVDLERFAPAPQDDRRAARRRLAPDGRPMAVVVGELSWQKGHDRLVAAWEEAPVPGVDLVLVGGHQPRRLRPFTEADLARLAPTQWGRTIRAVGQQDDVRPWLLAADVAVLPSRYESGCIALGEALACGTPVVTSDFAGAAEAVLEGPEEAAGAVVAGAATGDGGASGLITAAAAVLADPALRAQQSVAARRRAERVYAPAAVLERLDSAYTLAAGIRARRLVRSRSRRLR